MRRVAVAETALRHIEAIDEWWRAHRPRAPSLFAEELAEAFELLEHFADVGSPYVAQGGVDGARRVLLRGCRYHVYYVYDEDEVQVLAVWSALRGRGPDLSAA